MKYENNKIVYEIGDWVIGWHTKTIKFYGEAWQVGRALRENGISYLIPIGKDWTTGVIDVRPATQEEIDKALKEEKIMVGEYEVKFLDCQNVEFKDTSEIDNIVKCFTIMVGCQAVTKETFLKIGKKAGWL